MAKTMDIKTVLVKLLVKSAMIVTWLAYRIFLIPISLVLRSAVNTAKPNNAKYDL